MTKKQEDTSVSLHPLTFEEEIKKLSRPKREGSQAAESRNTKSDASPPRAQTR